MPALGEGPCRHGDTVGRHPLPPGEPGAELGACLSREWPCESVLAPRARAPVPGAGAVQPACTQQGEYPPGRDGAGMDGQGPDLSAPQVQYPLVDTQPQLCLKVSGPVRSPPRALPGLGEGAQGIGARGLQPHIPLCLVQPWVQQLSGPSDPLLVPQGRGRGSVTSPRGPRRRPACPSPPPTPRPCTRAHAPSLGLPAVLHEPGLPGEVPF